MESIIRVKQSAACRQRSPCTASGGWWALYLDLGAEGVGVALQDGLDSRLAHLLALLVVAAVHAVAPARAVTVAHMSTPSRRMHSHAHAGHISILSALQESILTSICVLH